MSHGGGCGCKISPAVLTRLLKNIPDTPWPHLLVGTDTSDDAAVYRLNEHQVLVATTDFFMPIVDNPLDFGRIAAANALSDIYAMGGKPLLALNLLGMPLDKLDESIITQVIKGGYEVCNKVGVAVAGGHSIDAREPFYGLSVCGIATENDIKTNRSAQSGDLLFLSKPLGIGVLTTAFKQRQLNETGYEELVFYASQLNDVGLELAKLSTVHAMTDVTGFSLIGHLLEICLASNLQAHLRVRDIPLIESAVTLATRGVQPQACARNWKNYRHQLTLSDTAMQYKTLLTDPQTNGGLLVSVAPEAANQVRKIFSEGGFKHASLIGTLDDKQPAHITIL